ncbi:Mg-chelatase subunit ChlI-like protein [Lentzea atacamensis]|uniref:Mg-chelatase subunit ChlI-like protein n=1 Tax=Lentzea atacamensis TaxID=531938 RepID=A0ABX9DWD8_9PSEU|nr:hypothetical protein [Lentzea atacamensis]RAS59472.1 Mg-chelatase subunit ChlI-like protein [Lentzea atacamensis]
MSDSATPSTDVTLTLEDGSTVQVSLLLAARVRGIDADGDLLILDRSAPAGLPDDSEYLIPLTPCCHATGKGADYSETGVACRRCYLDVDLKYGCPGRLALRVTSSIATVATVALDGETGHLVTVTAITDDGPDTISVNGASGGDDRELCALVRGAVAHSGHKLRRRVEVHLDPPQNAVPASAAVAAAVLASGAGTSRQRLAGTAVFGDVWRDGRLRPAHGVLPAVQAARARGIGRVIVPWSCRAEAGLVDDVEVLGAHTLAEVADWLHGNDNALREAGSVPAVVPGG